MFRQIHPDCRLISVNVYSWQMATTVTTTVLTFHLTAKTTSGSLSTDRWAYDDKKDTRPALEREWYVRPCDVKTLEADLDADGKNEWCVVFPAHERPGRAGLHAWHQLAVFGSDRGTPRLLGFRKVDKIWGFVVIIQAMEVVDFGRRKGLLYRYRGTDAGATPRPYSYFAEIYFIGDGQLNCAFAQELGESCGGSGVLSYNTTARLDHRDLDGDGMAELLLFDRAVDEKYWHNGWQGPDYLLKHLPDVYCYKDGRFLLAPDMLSTTDTMRWQYLSVTLCGARLLESNVNRAYYCRPEEESLTVFGCDIREGYAPRLNEPKPDDRVHMRAGGGGQPIWTVIMHRPTYGKVEKRLSANLKDYLHARIRETSATVMDYVFAVPDGEIALQIQRRSTVLKLFEGTSGLAILEEMWGQTRFASGWDVKEFHEHQASDGVFYQLDGIRGAPALICRSTNPRKQALVLAKIYLDFEGVEFVFAGGKPSGEADQVTVLCKVRSRAYGDRRMGDALYIAAVTDTTRPSWQGEVYGYIGQALEGLRRYRSEAERRR